MNNINFNQIYLLKFFIKLCFKLPVLQPDLGNARPPLTLNVLLVPLFPTGVIIKVNKEYTIRRYQKRNEFVKFIDEYTNINNYLRRFVTKNGLTEFAFFWYEMKLRTRMVLIFKG